MKGVSVVEYTIRMPEANSQPLKKCDSGWMGTFLAFCVHKRMGGGQERSELSR